MEQLETELNKIKEKLEQFKENIKEMDEESIQKEFNELWCEMYNIALRIEKESYEENLILVILHDRKIKEELVNIAFDLAYKVLSVVTNKKLRSVIINVFIDMWIKKLLNGVSTYPNLRYHNLC